MFSAVVVLTLFGADLILETIHLSVCWPFLNSLKPKCTPNQQVASPSYLAESSSWPFLGSASVQGSLLLAESVVLFHSEWLPKCSHTDRVYKSMSACGGRWNSAGVAPGLHHLCWGACVHKRQEAALFQLVTKAWPPWLVCLMDAFQLGGQQGVRKEFSALWPLQRAQARVVCSAAWTGFRYIWVSTVAGGVLEAGGCGCKLIPHKGH